MPVPEVSEQHRQQRMELATVFLFNTLIPHLAKLPPEESLSREQLYRLEAEFKLKYQLIGNDFEMSHVWSIAWATVVEATALGRTNTVAFTQVEQAWQLLTAFETNSQN